MVGCCSHVWLFGTTWTVAHQASLSMGFSKQGYWSGLLCLPPGDHPNPRITPSSLSLLHWQEDSLPLSVPGKPYLTYQFSSVQSLSRVRLFATPWIAAHQASLSITNTQTLLKLMPIESVMPSASHPLPSPSPPAPNPSQHLRVAVFLVYCIWSLWYDQLFPVLIFAYKLICSSIH